MSALSPEYLAFLEGIGLSSFVALDVETTGLDPQQEVLLELGAVRVVGGEIEARYQQLIDPQRPIPREITQLTGITDAMVAGQPPIGEVLDEFLSFLGRDPLVGHNISFDMGFLNAALKEAGEEPLANPLLDTLTLAQTLRYDLLNHRLSALAVHYGLSLEESHRALADAERSAMVLLRLIPETARLPLPVLETLAMLIGGTPIPNGFLYENLRRWVAAGNEISVSEGTPPEGPRLGTNVLEAKPRRDLTDLAAVFGPDGLLSRILPRYEPRPAQTRMAEDVLQALTGDEFLVAEAGTGVGKSLAYTVPALLFAHQLETDEELTPVVISCNTKNLQDQLFYKELPFLLEDLGLGGRAVLLKGRSNYLCRTKWRRVVFEQVGRLSLRDREELAKLVVWESETQTGDLDEHNGFHQASLWNQLASEPGFCTTRACTPGVCWLSRVRNAARKAHILVVNHALLLSDAAMDHGILPTYQHLVIDEAHSLERNAYEHFALTFSYHSLRRLLRDLYQRGRRNTGILTELETLITRWPPEAQAVWSLHHAKALQLISAAESRLDFFFNAFINLYRDKVAAQEFRFRRLYSSKEQIFEPVSDPWRQLVENFQRLHVELEALRKILDERQEEDETPPVPVIRFQNLVLELTGYLAIMNDAAKAPHEDWIYWFEIPRPGKFPQAEFYQVPLNVGQLMREKLFNELDSLILTSATLAVDGSFHFFLSRIGLEEDERVTTRIYPSPFSYPDQARIFVPLFLGYQHETGVHARAVELLRKILDQVPVNTLVLFTSYATLKEWERLLEPHFIHKRDRFFVQKSGLSRRALLNAFRQTPGAILLATESFWQGVDLPGSALQLMVITKLPFQVPDDPIVQAVSRHIKQQGGDDFMGYAVPQAVIKYRQGLGRLIRSASDFGAILSLDPRLFVRSYGTVFRNSTEIPHIAEAAEESLLHDLHAWLQTELKYSPDISRN